MGRPPSLLLSLVLLAAGFGNAKAVVTWIDLRGEILGNSDCPLGDGTRMWLGLYRNALPRFPNPGQWGVAPINRNYIFILGGTHLNLYQPCIEGSKVTVVMRHAWHRAARLLSIQGWSIGCLCCQFSIPRITRLNCLCRTSQLRGNN